MKPARRWFLTGPALVVGFENRDGQDFVFRQAPGSPDHRSRPLDVEDLNDPELAEAYDAHLTGTPGPPQTPLAALGLAPGVIEAFEHIAVPCTEALASLSDTACGRVPGGLTFKRQAIAYLERNHIPPAVQARLNDLQSQINALRKQLDGGNDGKQDG